MIVNLLNQLVNYKGSDLFISVDARPSIKKGHELIALGAQLLSKSEVFAMLEKLMSTEQMCEFLSSHECQFAYFIDDLSRFRVSAYIQRGNPAFVVRRIEMHIPAFDDLGLPQVLKSLIMMRKGLLIVVGATGSGKSTTLASLLNYRNINSSGHIITVEDPIEFYFKNSNCIVSQREVGVDTESFSIALRNVLRQSPDVIQIGEVRDRETMQQALTFSETGHLCVCTLHANNANQALDRILHFFPEDMHSQILMDLSFNVCGIIAQQLISNQSNKLIPVNEILVNTPYIAELIRNGQVNEIRAVMKKSVESGMKTFDQALYDAYIKGFVDYETALNHAESRNELRLMIKLNSSSSDVVINELSFMD